MDGFNFLEYLNENQIEDLFATINEVTVASDDELNRIHPRDLQEILDDYGNELAANNLRYLVYVFLGFLIHSKSC